VERLSNFLSNVKTHGPTYREVIEYVKMLNDHHKPTTADPSLLSNPSLTHDDMINVLKGIKTDKKDSDNPHLELTNFEVSVLVSFLHILKFAKVVKSMKLNSHLIKMLFLRNQMMAD